jgi:hypothetical protein
MLLKEAILSGSSVYILASNSYKNVGQEKNDSVILVAKRKRSKAKSTCFKISF